MSCHHNFYELAINVAGYIVKKILDKSDCANCLTLLSFNQVSIKYREILSHGGLTKPSALAKFVCDGFITLHTVKKLLLKYFHIIKSASLLALETYQATVNGFM